MNGTGVDTAHPAVLMSKKLHIIDKRMSMIVRLRLSRLRDGLVLHADCEIKHHRRDSELYASGRIEVQLKRMHPLRRVMAELVAHRQSMKSSLSC